MISSVFVKSDSKVTATIVITKMSVVEEVIIATYLLIVMTRRGPFSVYVLTDLREMVEFVTISMNVTKVLTHVTNMAYAKILWDHMHAVVWMAMKVTVKHASILMHALLIHVTT